jgi:hypothetical protein
MFGTTAGTWIARQVEKDAGEDVTRSARGLAPKADGLDAFSFNGSVRERSSHFLHGKKERAL